MQRRSALLFALLVAMLAGDARGAQLVFQDDQVVGVTGVVVLGRSYDVEFVDGSCFSVFFGCDDPEDFPFDLANAQIANEALVEAINDSPPPLPGPQLYRGCALAGSSCFIRTPGELRPGSDVFSAGLTVFAPGGSAQAAGGDLVGIFYDDDGRIFTRWTDVRQVPAIDPFGSTVLVTILGLLGWARLKDG